MSDKAILQQQSTTERKVTRRFATSDRRNLLIVSTVSMLGWCLLVADRLPFQFIVQARSSASSSAAFVLVRNPFMNKYARVPDKQTIQRYTTASSTSGDSSVSGTDDWHGPIIPFSPYADHTQVDIKDAPVSVQDAILRTCSRFVREHDDDNYDDHDGDDVILDRTTKLPMSAKQLLRLGAVWYLSADEFHYNQEMEESLDTKNQFLHKPQRLSIKDASKMLNESDYLRIHHTPRRFEDVYDYNWAIESNGLGKSQHDVVVAVNQAQGFIIIDKPALVPVHKTVDNEFESVLEQLEYHQQPPFEYLSTTQRLDINTSGLLAVATTKTFAAYFAELLRNKTQHSLDYSDDRQKTTATITKNYKCLVCIQEPTNSNATESWNALDEVRILKGLAENQTIIRHWQKKGFRAPREFVLEPPLAEDGTTVHDDWSECLLRIKKVGELVSLDPSHSDAVCQQLWPKSGGAAPPPTLHGVVELEIQLLTGRTHQIRGQLSCLGFPIAGDEQYGGALPTDNEIADSSDISMSQKLALHCFYLEFIDPDYVIARRKRGKEQIKGIKSDRRNSYRLENVWWTSILQQKSISTTIEPTTPMTQEEKNLLSDIKNRSTASSDADEGTDASGELNIPRHDLLPPMVQLSPGQHKYVLVKVRNTAAEPDGFLWFVRSASVKKCGGPYHANVANDLVEWIRAAGFNDDIEVTGGGRIDFNPRKGQAIVYGYSIGFGRGDHARVVEMIKTWSDGRIGAFVDNSPQRY